MRIGYSHDGCVYMTAVTIAWHDDQVFTTVVRIAYMCAKAILTMFMRYNVYALFSR